MFILITRCETPRPPQAQKIGVPSENRRSERLAHLYGEKNIPTYGQPLDDLRFAAVDPDLRFLVKRCLAHDPKERPSLRLLEQIGIDKVVNEPDPSESRNIINAWVCQIIYDAAVASSS